MLWGTSLALTMSRGWMWNSAPIRRPLLTTYCARCARSGLSRMAVLASCSGSICLSRVAYASPSARSLPKLKMRRAEPASLRW